ncbi:MAG: ParB/RepB/Spo0J family partition protein [Singulisphaera sp.]|nr:ParB/RepB/Spo0J family partition protein [Singulisphaera sp.]
MGKLDELRRTAGGNVDESMGTFLAKSDAPARETAGGPRPPDPKAQGISRAQERVVELSIDRIGRDPNQPREEFDEESLARLSESLKSRGQLQPIRVRWDDSRELYVLLCGERRWRAARMAGMPTMTAVIHEGPLGPGEMLALQLIENCIREDLRPVEQAKAFKILMERNGWSASELGRQLNLIPSVITRALALLDMPVDIQDRVEQGVLAPRTAYEISKVEDPAEQRDLAERAIAKKLTRDEVIEEVRANRERPTQTRRVPEKIEVRTPHGRVVIFPNTPDDAKAAFVAALDQIEGKGQAA